MILRELLAEYGITTIRELSRRGALSRKHAWNLWHGRSNLGLKLARHVATHTGIPLARLVELEPTPRTPNRGKGGRRSASLPSAEETHTSPPDT